MKIKKAQELMKEIKELEKTSIMDGIKGLENKNYFNKKMEKRNKLIECKAKKSQMLEDAKGELVGKKLDVEFIGQLEQRMKNKGILLFGFVARKKAKILKEIKELKEIISLLGEKGK